MEKTRVVDLEPEANIDKALYHLSGKCILEAGEDLLPVHVEALKESGIERVMIPENEQEKQTLKQNVRYETISLESLKVGETINTAIYDSEYNLLLQKGTEITSLIKETLRDRGITQVCIKQAERPEVQQQFQKYQELLEDEKSEDSSISKLLDQVEEEAAGGEEQERRRHKRYEMNINIRYYVEKKNSSGWSSRAYPAYLKDISRSGVCLKTQRSLRIGARICIIFRFSSETVVEGYLDVVRQSREGPGLYEVGAEFDRVERR